MRSIAFINMVSSCLELNAFEIRDRCDDFLCYGLMLIESWGRGDVLNKADPVEAVMQQDLGGITQPFLYSSETVMQ